MSHETPTCLTCGHVHAFEADEAGFDTAEIIPWGGCQKCSCKAPNYNQNHRLASPPAVPMGLSELIDKHARIAVLECQHQGDSYQPTAYELNELKNMHHILSQFADALLAALRTRG